MELRSSAIEGGMQQRTQFSLHRPVAKWAHHPINEMTSRSGATFVGYQLVGRQLVDIQQTPAVGGLRRARCRGGRGDLADSSAPPSLTFVAVVLADIIHPAAELALMRRFMAGR